MNEELLARLIRWGKDYEPEWYHGEEVTAPAADKALVTKKVSGLARGYIHGFLISIQEANDFKIKWTSGKASYSIRVIFATKGSTECVDTVAINANRPADPGTEITINNVNAGGAGIIYQARLLVGEI